ncbi:phosphate regulon sensor histidine kinase PhoR [Shewanella marina]|uniref:phosphate regulon sensor histidine kinase PhoR n=1 Tax=Shewanella marina TaxID=487319 RepID=UPI00046EE7A8|nr:phosphate regulon sensor histidine kinase PhoR [Shewanella marina]
MVEPHTRYKLISRLVLYIALATIIGLLVGQVTLSLLVASIVLLAWHYRQLIRLQIWLWQMKKLTPPQGQGSWEGVFNGVYRLQRKNRKRLNQLADLLARFRLAAEALPDAAVVLDSEYNILWCNKLAQRLLGFLWPQDSGQRIDNLLRHPDFSRYLVQAKYGVPLELPSPVHEGRILEFRIIAYGEHQLLLIARDISRIRQLEGMRREFVANVSHELKTPLTVLQGYLEMMESMQSDDPMVARPVELMQQQTQRMKLLVEQLLALSRIEDEDDIDWAHEIDMGLLMKGLEIEAEALSLGRYQLKFECDPQIAILGNEFQIISACSNLISNAIRYTPESGSITVKWQAVSDGAMFSVSDSGEGIAAQHLPRLTERFYRVDTARSRQTGGSGLGLAIVKHALSHHHSELVITSELGQGSTFSFTIPSILIVQKKRID